MMKNRKIIDIEELYAKKLPSDSISASFEQDHYTSWLFHFQKQISQNHLFVVKTFLLFLVIIVIALLMGEKHEIFVPRLSIFISPVFLAAIIYQYQIGRDLFNKANIISQRGVFLEKNFPELGSFFQENEKNTRLKIQIRSFLLALGVMYLTCSISLVLGSYFCAIALGQQFAVALSAFLIFSLSVFGTIAHKKFMESPKNIYAEET